MIATKWYDNSGVVVLALLSTGKTTHSVSHVLIAYTKALIGPELLTSYVSGANPVDFVVQPVLVSAY